MDPDQAIEAYYDGVWSEDAKGDEEPINVVKRTLLAALKEHPRNDDLLIEIGIFHEVVTEEWDLALSYFDRVVDKGDSDYVYYKARCLACLLRKDDALALIARSGFGYDTELMALKTEIEEDQWAEYARLGPA